MPPKTYIMPPKIYSMTSKTYNISPKINSITPKMCNGASKIHSITPKTIFFLLKINSTLALKKHLVIASLHCVALAMTRWFFLKCKSKIMVLRDS